MVTREFNKKQEEEKQRREVIAREKKLWSSYTDHGDAEIIGVSNEQCVEYAKRISGINRSLGYAGTALIQGYEPKIGAIGIEKSIVGHAVYIENIIGDNAIITESNYKPGKITRRVLPLNLIKGYIYN